MVGASGGLLTATCTAGVAGDGKEENWPRQATGTAVQVRNLFVPRISLGYVFPLGV